MSENAYFKPRNVEVEHQRLMTQVEIGLKTELPIWKSFNLQSKNAVSWGCGPGHYDAELMEKTDLATLTGLDSNSKSIEYAEKHYSSSILRFQNQDVLNTPHQIMADINYARFLLQHLQEDQRLEVVKRMADATVPDGAVILIDYNIEASSHNPFCEEYYEMRGISEARMVKKGKDRHVGSKLSHILHMAGLKYVGNFTVSWEIKGDDLQKYKSAIVDNYRSFAHYQDEYHSKLIDKIEEWFDNAKGGPGARVVEGVNFCAGRKAE